jgi:hypothetical protein
MRRLPRRCGTYLAPGKLRRLPYEPMTKDQADRVLAELAEGYSEMEAARFAEIVEAVMVRDGAGAGRIQQTLEGLLGRSLE